MPHNWRALFPNLTISREIRDEFESERRLVSRGNLVGFRSISYDYLLRQRFPPTSSRDVVGRIAPASEIRRQWKIPKKYDSGGIFRHGRRRVRLSGLGIRFVWRRWTARRTRSCTRITRSILSSYPVVPLPSRPSWSSFVSYSNPEPSYRSGCSEISSSSISSQAFPFLFNSSAILLVSRYFWRHVPLIRFSDRDCGIF